MSKKQLTMFTLDGTQDLDVLSKDAQYSCFYILSKITSTMQSTAIKNYCIIVYVMVAELKLNYSWHSSFK